MKVEYVVLKPFNLRILSRKNLQDKESDRILENASGVLQEKYTHYISPSLLQKLCSGLFW